MPAGIFEKWFDYSKGESVIIQLVDDWLGRTCRQQVSYPIDCYTALCPLARQYCSTGPANVDLVGGYFSGLIGLLAAIFIWAVSGVPVHVLFIKYTVNQLAKHRKLPPL